MHRHARHIVLGVQILLVVFVALFVAMGINSMVAAQIAGLTPNDGVAKLADAQRKKDALASASEARAQNQPAFNNLLYNRNLFNQNGGEEGASSAPPMVEEEPGLGDEEPVFEAPAAAPGSPVPTDMMVLLVGTQVNEDPAYSLAILKDLDASDGLQDQYKRTGSVIREDATIVLVDRERVYFSVASKGGAIEFIDLETTEDDLRKRATEAAKSAKPAPVVSKESGSAGSEKNGGATGGPAPAPAPAPRSSGPIDPNAIVADGSGGFALPRDMAEQIRANPNMLKDQATFGPPPQIQPVYSGGGVNGFRVLGIQGGSIYSKLGIKNGDIIMNVNGKVVDNPQKALAFFDQLGPNQDVTVKVNRRGRHTDLKYSMQ